MTPPATRQVCSRLPANTLTSNTVQVATWHCSSKEPSVSIVNSFFACGVQRFTFARIDEEEKMRPSCCARTPCWPPPLLRRREDGRGTLHLQMVPAMIKEPTATNTCLEEFQQLPDARRHGRRAVRQGSTQWVAAVCGAAAVDAGAGVRAWPPASSPVSKQRRDQRRLALLFLFVQGCQVPQGPRVHPGSCGTWQPWTSKAGAPAAADHVAASTQGWRLEARQEHQHQQQRHHKQQQLT